MRGNRSSGRGGRGCRPRPGYGAWILDAGRGARGKSRRSRPGGSRPAIRPSRWRRAVRDQRIADEIEVLEQFLRAAVAVFVFLVPAFEVRLDEDEIAFEPVAHDVELAPIGLIAETLGRVAEGHGAEGLVAAEAAHEFIRGPAQQTRMREDAGETRDAREIGEHRRARVQAHREHRGGGCHEGIAVAIAAYPRAEAQETRHANGIAVTCPVHAAYAFFEAAIKPRHGVEQA